MPTLIRVELDRAAVGADPFTFVADGEPLPERGDVVVTLDRLLSEGAALRTNGRRVGVRLQPSEAVEGLSDALADLACVQLVFAKFRDGRPYSSARVLRERFHYQGEVRAVGEVLRDQAQFMVRCGFDAFEPADGSTAEQWLAATRRYRHVYQRGSDDRTPIFVERDLAAAGLGHNQPGDVAEPLDAR